MKKLIPLRVHQVEALSLLEDYGCSNSDFLMVRCSFCGCQYLYDAELSRLFYDPSNLKQSYFDFVGDPWPSCKQCGRDDWKMQQLAEDEQSEVARGSWGWLFPSRL